MVQESKSIVEDVCVGRKTWKVCIMSATVSPRAFEPPDMQKHTRMHARYRFPSQRGGSLSSSVLLINEAGAAGRPREAGV